MTKEEPANGSSNPRFQLLTKEMVEGFDFEQILNGTESADCREYQDLFSNAQGVAAENGNENAVTLYSALGALCGFHFRPDDVNDPYGPMVQMDGKRSPIPADFRPVADVVASMAETATNGTLKARLCDVAWLLNRRRVDLGLAAISAYCQIVRDVAAGTKKFRFEGSNSPCSAQSRGLLKRALSLAMMKSVGLGKQEEADIRQLVELLFHAASTGINLRDVHRMAKLALQYDIVPPLEVGGSIEAWIQKNAAVDDHSRLDLLRLASSAYHEGGSMPDHFRCRLEIVDTLVRMAQQVEENSATLASGFLSDAISELHGIPEVKERRRELRHRLVDVQTNISEEMGRFSQEIDLKEIIDDREASFEGLHLRDMMFAFAAMSHSPAPEELRKQATKSIENHPLSSIFGQSFHDRDGKVSYRAAGADLMSAPTDESLRPSIAQSERIRREIFAAGDIQTARRLIVSAIFPAPFRVDVSAACSVHLK
ncbi:DUF7380 domain-containing protein [Rhizobium ruizarguesonis]|uniref:DUF7380 domain-containing protein n=1 Tax=Rhizobium ruizarguesonis TaxID=2081791 RepID=UPI00102FA18D|nr:hypothetical protein [Rhizobium ruizarguesonis]TBF14715.1 hypothetical protein ELG95_14860 [Rhizobium ruizarguesonis]